MRAVKESSPLINFSATKHHDDRLKAKKSVRVVHHSSVLVKSCKAKSNKCRCPLIFAVIWTGGYPNGTDWHGTEGKGRNRTKERETL